MGAIKPSRVDLCVDLLLRAEAWKPELVGCFVTRARDVNSYLQSHKLSGYSIGKGAIVARLYDKPREIRMKSHKDWMYDVWGIESVADDHRIIRVEFQMRRDVLREIGMRTWEDLRSNLPSLWIYCSQMWLHLVDDASLHHTQQHVLPWWQVVRNGFEGVQGAEPLVRTKAINHDLRRHAAQVMGGMTSMIGLMRQGESVDPDEVFDSESHCLMAAMETLTLQGIDDAEFTRRVIRKQAKQVRSGPGFTEGLHHLRP